MSIVGYTNAGKSTLLNTLTQSNVPAEDKLFATLDTSSRRSIPGGQQRSSRIQGDPRLWTHSSCVSSNVGRVGICGPSLHVADISNPNVLEQIESVRGILSSLGLDSIPELVVFNKIDAAEPDVVQNLCERYDAIGVCALQRSTTRVLYQRIQKELLDRDGEDENQPAPSWSPI